MASANPMTAGPRWLVWLGRVLSALPVLMMALSAVMKLTHDARAVADFTGFFGWQERALTWLGLLELTVVAIYLIPPTAVLGAILVTGYLGGAVATHFRVGDPQLVGPLVLGVLAWAGLYLRDARVRSLIPLRKAP